MIRPSITGTSPIRARTSVDLPAPLGPKTAQCSLADTRHDVWRRYALSRRRTVMSARVTKGSLCILFPQLKKRPLGAPSLASGLKPPLRLNTRQRIGNG